MRPPPDALPPLAAALRLYLFRRTEESQLRHLLAPLLTQLPGVGPSFHNQDRLVSLFLSEFRQRRAEYFSWNWRMYQGMIEVNRLEYLDWLRSSSPTAAPVSSSAASAAPPPSPPGQLPLEIAGLHQLQQVAHPVLLLVTAPYSTWCRLLDPVFAQLSQRLLVARIDASRHWEVVDQLGVKRFPEIFLHRPGGAPLERFPFSAPEDVDSLNTWLLQHGLTLTEPIRWRMALAPSVIEELRRGMTEERRARSVKEALRALGGCLQEEPTLLQPAPVSWNPSGSMSIHNPKPVIIILGGGIASGKSSLLIALRDSQELKDRWAGIVCVEADRFKMADPLFEAIVALGSVSEASKECHRESTDQAEELLLTALEQGRDVVFDGTAKWAPFVLQTIEMVRHVHCKKTRRGPGYRGLDLEEQYWIQDEDREACMPPYEIWLVASHAAVNVAVGRSVRRAILDGRSQSLSELLRSHKLFAAAFESYFPVVDRVLLFDNTKSRPLEATPPLLCEKRGRGEPLKIYNEATYASFIANKNLNERATSMYHLFDPDYVQEAQKSAAEELEEHAAPTRIDFAEWRP